MSEHSHLENPTVEIEAEGGKDLSEFRDMIKLLQEEGVIPKANVNHALNEVPEHCPLNNSQMVRLRGFSEVLTDERMDTLCSFLDWLHDIRKGSVRTAKWLLIGLLIAGITFFLLAGISVRLKGFFQTFSFMH